MLKVRDAFFTAIFGAVCIITIFTHRRPALFYVGRYLSAGQDPAKMAAYDELHEVPIGRHAFRVLSVVWGIGLIVEAGSRMTLAELLPTTTFLEVSPFVTGIRPWQPVCLHGRVRPAVPARNHVRGAGADDRATAPATNPIPGFLRAEVRG